MSKLSKQDEKKRAEELTVNMHRLALIALLKKEKKGVYAHYIERHGGRQNKAIRLLTEAGHIVPSTAKANKGYYGKMYWVTETFDRMLPEYAKSAGNTDMENNLAENLMKFLFESSYYNYGDNLYMLGGSFFDSSKVEDLAYVWLHRDEYVFIGVVNERPFDDTYTDPMPWDKCRHPVMYMSRKNYESYPKILLRNAVEMYAGGMLCRLVKDDMSIKDVSYDVYFKNIVVNITKVLPTAANIDTVIDSCRRTIDIMTEYMNMCKRMRDLLETSGGDESYHRCIIEKAIDHFMVQAPVFLSSEDVDSESFNIPMRFDLLKTIMRYALDHADVMSYDRLFDDRPPSIKMEKSTEDTLSYSEIDEDLIRFVYGSNKE